MAEENQNAAELAVKLEKAIDVVMAKGTEFSEKAARLEQASETQKRDLDEALTTLNETKAQLDAVKQAMAGADNGADEKKKALTMGQAFAQKMGKAGIDANDRHARFSLQLKAGEVTNSPGSRPLGGITDLGFRQPVDTPLRLRDLLTSIEIQTDSVDFTYVKSFTNNAGMVAETVKKPQSELEFDNETIPTRVAAHWIKVSKQALSDNTFLQGQIDNRLRRGLAEKVEQQILLGDGTGQNLSGLIANSTAFVDTYVAQIEKANKLDVIRLAMLQAVLAGYQPNAAILNPIDSTLIGLTKDEAGGYLIQNPANGVGNMTMWGLPVVDSTSMSVGDFLVGDLTQAELYNRWAASVAIGYENDDFTKNLVTILGEERLALGVYDATALVRGDFSSLDPDEP